MSETPAPAPPRRPLSRATVPLALAGIAGVLIVLYAWRLPPFRGAVETTDDAYVRGGVTVISPKLDGYVAEVLVQDFAQVRPGQLLVRIEDRIFRQRLDQARANLASQQAALANNLQARRSAEANVDVAAAQVASAQATLNRERTDLRRYETLFQRGYVPAQQLDQARAAVLQAEAQVNQGQAQRRIARENVTSASVGRGSLEAAVQGAEAAVELARIDLDNTRIVSPRAGQLSEVGVRVGQYVTPGTQLMSLVPERVWVVANFKETQMRRIRPGQPATLKVDALGRGRLRGRVETIAPATGSEFSVLRPDNATGNFTKVVQRVPVRIVIEPGQPDAARLRPGLSVTASVDTSGAR
jgi:multidrug resistance efflux pump